MLYEAVETDLRFHKPGEHMALTKTTAFVASYINPNLRKKKPPGPKGPKLSKALTPAGFEVAGLGWGPEAS